MTTHPLDGRLAAIGLDPADLDPDVLDVLRAAHRRTTDPLEAAAEDAILEPPTAAERAAAQRAFARDVAAHLGNGTDLADRPDLEAKDDR